MTKKQLVHGLTETVELKDWDSAIILAALKLYIEKSKVNGKNKAVISYAKLLQEKLRKPFTRLVKRTKLEHRRLENLMLHEKKLIDFMEARQRERH